MKINILDTNVLLDRPLEETILNISKDDEPVTIIIPLPVLMELDTFKKGHGARNVNCRSTIRFLESLRQFGKECGCKLHEGIPYNNVIVQVDARDEELDSSKVDNKIILLAKEYQECKEEADISIITEDIHERVIADVLAVKAESMNANLVDIESLYSGKSRFRITDNQVQEFESDYHNRRLKTKRELYPNQFCIMEDSLGKEHYGIYNEKERCIMGLKPVYEAWNIKPRKSKKHEGIIQEQAMLMHMLLDPNIKLVTAIAPSGCGKTLLTLACALSQTLEQDTYDKIIVMRPLVPIGKDMGALPGDKLEKLEPWMASTFDNLEFLLQEYTPKGMDGMCINTNDKIYDLIQTGKLELEAMTYIRGRSIPKQFIIVDDAQNLTPEQAISILTRAGEGTKVVFLGDISKQQIDDHRLSPASNGLACLVDKAKGKSTIAGHITMEEIVRSELARLGVEIGNEI